MNMAADFMTAVDLRARTNIFQKHLPEDNLVF